MRAAASILLGALLLLSHAAPAQVTNLSVGDVFQITMTRDSVREATNGSSGTSHDVDTIVERVISESDNDIVLEYDLPGEVSAEERARQWQFPARVFRQKDGSLRLVNASELAERVDSWLKAAGWDRRVCGRLIFTWNAFRIDCEPETVLQTVEAFDIIRTPIRSGQRYRNSGALDTGTLVSRSKGADGEVLFVELKVDPEAIRRSRAEADVGVGEIMRKPVSLEQALERHSKELIEGIVFIEFATDRTGQVQRRTKITTTRITRADGQVETETVKQTIERKRI